MSDSARQIQTPTDALEALREIAQVAPLFNGDMAEMIARAADVLASACGQGSSIEEQRAIVFAAGAKAISKLAWLVANCNSVHLECNAHRGNYLNAEAEFATREGEPGNLLADATPEIREECIKRDTIVTLQIYPDTPVGFFHWVHYDVEQIIDSAYRCFREMNGEKP